jgi:hypothetical protein
MPRQQRSDGDLWVNKQGRTKYRDASNFLPVFGQNTRHKDDEEKVDLIVEAAGNDSNKERRKKNKRGREEK